MAKIASEAQWKSLATTLKGKQEKLVAGTNISINDDGKTISATDTKYTAGTGLKLADGAFSADTTVLAQQSDLTTLETKLTGQLTAVYRYKDSVENFEALPKENQTTGDVYNVEDTGINYAWNGTEWDALGGTVDLSAYAKTTDMNSAITKATAGLAKSTDLEAKQDKLTAGDNITIDEDGKTISAKDTTYTAGNGLTLTATAFAVDEDVVATKTYVKEQLNGATHVVETFSDEEWANDLGFDAISPAA